MDTAKHTLTSRLADHFQLAERNTTFRTEIVGFFMFAAVREIDFGSLLDGFPALMTLILIPLTYSITNGIGAGLITYCFLRAITGRAREVPPLLWGISAAFALYFLIPQI